jgi:U3 small nucleolar RNA-associated protein 8
MIWSYALSPESVATSMDSYDFEDQHVSNHNNNNSIPNLTDKKIFAIALTERKQHKLKFISYGLEDLRNLNGDEENQSSSMSVVNEEDRQTNEIENLKEVKDKSLPVKNQIVGLKFSKDSKFVYSLFINGNISIWKFSIDSNDSDSPILTRKIDSLSNKNRKIIFHQFIKPEQLKFNSRTDKIDYLLLTAESITDNKNSIIVRIFSINSNEILEISKSTINDIKDIQNIQFSYDISGKFIILENKPELVIKSYELPFVNNEQIIRIGGVFKHEPLDSSTSIMCASTNRILVTKGSTIALIDIQYEALLSSLDLYSRSKETKGSSNPKPARNATLLNVPTVNGNSLKSKKTFALLVLKNTKENYSQIQYVSIDVGLGKLRDALISLPNNDESNIEEEFASFSSYFNKNDQNVSGKNLKEINYLNDLITENNKELTDVYNKLVNIKQTEDIKSLENHMISYLKNKPFGQLYEDEEFKVYEYEKDRFVDPKFFKLLTLLLFNYDSQTDKISLDEENVPEKGLTYVLTHPLFPTRYAHGFLKVLEELPRLQRQAIVTCVNIPCGDFILELSNTDNDEIFKDIINRLIDEFSSEEITQETIKIMKQQSNNKKVNNFDLDKIIKKIIKFNIGYEVLNSFIDSNGLILSLHYSNDETQLSKLISQTQLKVDSLIEDTQLLTLISQSLTNAEAYNIGKTGKKSKKNKSKDKTKKSDSVSTDVQEIEVGISKLDMMLKMGESVSQSAKKNNNASVSSYTIDRLII